MPARQARADLVGVGLGDQADAAEHARDRDRLRRAHPAEPGGHDQPPGERAAEVLARDLGERLVGPLQDALGADVLPAAGGQAAPREQVAALELVERLRRGPAADEVAVGEQDGRRARAGRQDRDRLARLDDERLAVLQLRQRGDDRIEARPVAGRLRVRGVDDEVLGILGDRQVVLEQAQDRLLAPAAAAQRGGAGLRRGSARARCTPARGVGARRRTGRGREARATCRPSQTCTPRREGRDHPAAQPAPRVRAPAGGRHQPRRVDLPLELGIEDEHVGVGAGLQVALARPQAEAAGGRLADQPHELGGAERVVDERHDQLDPGCARREREDVGTALALDGPADVVRGDQVEPVRPAAAPSEAAG